MNVVIFIQVRMSSVRLPGKALAPLAGKPMIQWLLDSLTHCGLPLVLITSDKPDDDPLASFCRDRDVRFLRGPLDDVAARFALAVETCGCDAFVRISGDSPLLDYRLVNQAVGLFRETGPDLATNVLQRTFPKGQSVEVLASEAFSRARRDMVTPAHREHVTTLWYEHPEIFRLQSLTSGEDWGGLQMSVDTPEDFAMTEILLSELDGPPWEYGWRELALRMRRLRYGSDKEGTC